MFSHLRLGVPKGPFLAGVLVKILKALLPSNIDYYCQLGIWASQRSGYEEVSRMYMYVCVFLLPTFIVS